MRSPSARVCCCDIALLLLLHLLQVVVIAPSQELAMQISRVAQSLFPQDSRTAVQQAIGGANLRRQAESIAQHQPIMVVGTPGRVVDLVG
jgi:superfamily II DNA/RNA helicase